MIADGRTNPLGKINGQDFTIEEYVEEIKDGI